MVGEDGEFLRPMVRAVVQEFLEAEMTQTVGAEKGERAEGRLSYRSGYYTRSLVTRVGKLELRVPQDRHGRFSTEIFERYQRSEKALVAALTQMYIQGVSTRKVQAISEELCGHSFSASAISDINKKLDNELGRFARRELGRPSSDPRSGDGQPGECHKLEGLSAWSEKPRTPRGNLRCERRPSWA